MTKTKSAAVALSFFLAAVLNLTAGSEIPRSGGHWVSAWGAAVQNPFRPSVSPLPEFENQTIRMVVRPTVGGERVRVRLSNAFGDTAVSIGAARISLVIQGAKIVTESDRALTFGGRPSVSIPPGAPVLSDPVDLKVRPFAEIAVSLYLPDKTVTSTMHAWGQHDSYISGPGDFTAKLDMPNATVRASWYWLTDVEVWASKQTVATVTLGDSITDGAGVIVGDYADWPDILASRLAGKQRLHGHAVINEGISGNRILHDGAGVSALARFDRDVLAQPGVANLIVLEGINDIGWPQIKSLPAVGNAPPKQMPYAGEEVSAQDLIAGLRQIIERAHQHGIRVFGATLTPYEGAVYYTTDGEAIRQAVNQWIRTSGAFDAVFDFDAAVRDPEHPTQFREGYHSGDHLHPSAAGYKAMADAVDISALRPPAVGGTKK